MEQQQLRRLLVLDRSKRLVGIVTLTLPTGTLTLNLSGSVNSRLRQYRGSGYTWVVWANRTSRLQRSDGDYRLSWSSQGGLVQHSGQLELEPRGSDTELKLSLEYRPQNRNTERMLAKLLSDPQAMLDQDLERLCKLLEARPQFARLA